MDIKGFHCICKHYELELSILFTKNDIKYLKGGLQMIVIMYSEFIAI